MSATLSTSHHPSALLPDLVFDVSNESSPLSSSDEADFSRPDSSISLPSKASRSLAVDSIVPDHSIPFSPSASTHDQLPSRQNMSSPRYHKLRKPPHPPPTSFRPATLSLLPSSNPNLNLYLPVQASSSAIARATASTQSFRDPIILPAADGGSFSDLRELSRCPSTYTRISPNMLSLHESSNTSGSSSITHSKPMYPPPAPSTTRKLSKRRALDGPSNTNPPAPTIKSKSSKRSFKFTSPFSSKNPSPVSLYSKPVPPVLSPDLTRSTSPFHWLSSKTHDQPTNSVYPSANESRSPSPVNLSDPSRSEHGFYGRVYASDNAFHESYGNGTCITAGQSSIPSSPTSAPVRCASQIWRQGGRNKGANLMRRWSLLEIPDEVLAIEFEEVRRATELKNRKRSLKTKSDNHSQASCSAEGKMYTPGAFVYGGPSSGHRFWLGGDDDDGSDDDRRSDASEADWDVLEHDDPSTKGGEGEEQDERDWKRSRRALFCCRELIRTEKSYLMRLIQLLDRKTLTPPPTLIMTYLPALIAASSALVEDFSLDPTAYGISKAFVDTELLLENALVAYCGVVGDVFANKRSERKKLVNRTRRNSMVDSGLVIGGTGQHMRGSQVMISEEYSGPQKKTDDRRQTAPAAFGWEANEVNLRPETEAALLLHRDRLGREKTGRSLRLKRTMSLFKRKSLPPLPAVKIPRESHSGPPSPQRSRNSSIFSFSPIVRKNSGISVFGMGYPSRLTPIAKSSPPQFQAQEIRPYAYSDPAPPPDIILEHQTLEVRARPASSIGYFKSVSTPWVASSPGHDDRVQEKIPTARDLAILPTQRATRFVLLFRDLLNHTPEHSLTRPLVERALEGAVRIADKCDRAQGNAAFLRRA